jgi:hypothetical protein
MCEPFGKMYPDRASERDWAQLRSSTLKNQQATLFLAAVLAAPAFALADNVPGHSESGNTFITHSEGFPEQPDLQSNAARCNFLSSSAREEGLRTSSIAGASFGGITKGESMNLFDFGEDQGTSSDSDNRMGHGKHNRGDVDGIATGIDCGTPSPAVPVPELGSQTLLLVGLAGLGMLFFLRKTLTDTV